MYYKNLFLYALLRQKGIAKFMSKKKEKIKVSFVGTNATDVAGSCTHIEMEKYQILLECGLTQGGTVLEDYKNNSAKFPFHPSKIDYVFIGHSHIDHIGLLPRLVKEGFKGKIIVPKGNKDFIRELCKDCAFIIEKDSETLMKKYKRKQVNLIYDINDVIELMDYIVEYDFNQKVTLNDSIEFCFQHSQHIINSAQIELWLTQNNHTKKIVYTSDLGNIAVQNNYVHSIDKIEKANLWIGEATYSKFSKQLTSNHRKKDLEKIQCVIDQCIENRSSCLIPTFSLHRTQEMITEIYKLYKDRDSLDIDFIIASPLANKMCDIFLKELEGEQLKLFEDVMSWDKLKRVRDYDNVVKLLGDKRPHIWLASSGFMVAGYSRTICANLLGSAKNTIILSGYAPEGSLAYKIKEGKQKYITIDDKVCRNSANAVVLTTYSSHMQYHDLLKYYSDVNCDKICIIHSDKKYKNDFCKALQEELSKKNKTQRVVCVTKNSSVNL